VFLGQDVPRGGEWYSQVKVPGGLKKYLGMKKMEILTASKDTHLSSRKTLLCPSWIGAGSKYRTGE